VINRDRVAGIIGAGNPTTSGHDLLTRLEDAGYRVVRAGLVPRFDDLDDISRVMDDVGRFSGHVLNTSGEAKQAALTIRHLRDLALMVLRIERTDVDKTDG
jgi:hypothetical protein